MHYDAVFRREEGDPRSQLSREALTANEHGFEFDPTPCWTGRGVIRRARDALSPAAADSCRTSVSAQLRLTP